MATNSRKNSSTKSPSFKILKAPINLSEIPSIINKINLPPEGWYNRRQIIDIYGINYDHLRRKLIDCKGKYFFDLNANSNCLYYHINDIKRNIITYEESSEGWYTALEISRIKKCNYNTLRHKLNKYDLQVKNCRKFYNKVFCHARCYNLKEVESVINFNDLIINKIPKGWYTARQISEKYNRDYANVRDKLLTLYHLKKIKRILYKTTTNYKPFYYYNIKDISKFMK